MSRNPPLLHESYLRSKALGDEITELFGFITAATCELLVKIRELDQQKLWELDGICSCAHWLNWKCGIGMNAGRERVRVANALGDLPKISAAFRNGEISFSKVRAITRVATQENQGLMLQIARHGTAHHVESVVSGYRLVHEGGFVCEKDATGKVIFKDRHGDLVDNSGILPFTDPGSAVAKLKERLEDRHIHADTCVSQWDGALLDRHHVVSMMWHLDHPIEAD